MRRTDPMEPDVAAGLAAIDATLGGEAVDPSHAELAELALILAAQRPELTAPALTRIDDRVAGFSAPSARTRRRPGWRWLAPPAAALAAVALVVVVLGGRSDLIGSRSSATTARRGAPVRETPAATTAAATAATTAASSSASAGSGASAPTGPPPSPSRSGNRQVVQSARLALSTAPTRLDGVAQQVFDVVGAENGYVDRSHVSATGGPAANASFQLSVPVGNLQRTLSELSRLRGAHVLSRSDDTSDITGEVGGTGRRLAEDRAVRRSLLRQLAAAATTEAIDTLRARLRDANAAIGRDSSALSALHRRVDYSTVALTIRAANAPVATRSRSGGFTLRRAAHDAGRVLVVVAGVALIALAVLVPVGLVVALVAWVAVVTRRRRREATLDLV